MHIILYETVCYITVRTRPSASRPVTNSRPNLPRKGWRKGRREARPPAIGHSGPVVPTVVAEAVIVCRGGTNSYHAACDERADCLLLNTYYLLLTTY